MFPAAPLLGQALNICLKLPFSGTQHVRWNSDVEKIDHLRLDRSYDQDPSWSDLAEDCSISSFNDLFEKNWLVYEKWCVI
jgi:hypothetical protein